MRSSVLDGPYPAPTLKRRCTDAADLLRAAFFAALESRASQRLGAMLFGGLVGAAASVPICYLIGLCMGWEKLPW